MADDLLKASKLANTERPEVAKHVKRPLTPGGAAETEKRGTAPVVVDAEALDRKGIAAFTQTDRKLAPANAAPKLLAADSPLTLGTGFVPGADGVTPAYVVAAICHEVRNPMTPIVAFADCVAARAGDDAPSARHAQTLIRLCGTIESVLQTFERHSEPKGDASAAAPPPVAMPHFSDIKPEHPTVRKVFGPFAAAIGPHVAEMQTATRSLREAAADDGRLARYVKGIGDCVTRLRQALAFMDDEPAR
ncbi:MAG: hypothetical protein HY903_11880 [Deltaproteobacteria bacterium]|nr:hypothetical protein [Deltaproteobacteria bacterium]